MNFLGTVILPKRYQDHGITVNSDIAIIEQCLKDQLSRYEEKSYTKERTVICECSAKAAQLKTYSFFKDQISKLYLEWNKLSHDEQFGMNILRIDPNLSQMVQFYYEEVLKKTYPDSYCSDCEGKGSYIDIKNPDLRYSWRDIGGKYSGIWRKIDQEDDHYNNILLVNEVPIASNVIVFPDHIWLEKPESSIIDFSFKSMSSKEWNDKFFESIKPYGDHVAVAIDFYRDEDDFYL